MLKEECESNMNISPHMSPLPCPHHRLHQTSATVCAWKGGPEPHTYIVEPTGTTQYHEHDGELNDKITKSYSER